MTRDLDALLADLTLEEKATLTAGLATETAHLAQRRGDAVLVPGDEGPTPVELPGWYVQGGTYRVHLARSVDDVVATVDVARQEEDEALTRL